MRVFRLYFDKDKETEWLNRMADDGYAMVSFFSGIYTFVPCEKGEWQYQIDIGNGFFNVKKQYSEFMEEMGIEIVQAWGPWVIVRRKKEEGEFSLYTDVDSKIGQYKKILLLFKIATGIEALGLIYSIYAAFKGYAPAWGMILLVMAILIVFFNMIVKTKNIIAELRERKGEEPAGSRGRPVSPAIPAGFLLNSVNLLAGDYIPTPLRLVLLGFSVGLILYGAVSTAVRKKGSSIHSR